jgi:hypothetical protein
MYKVCFAAVNLSHAVIDEIQRRIFSTDQMFTEMF